MKPEFGKKLIEEFIPTWDLTHVIDTSGAYIPGHGTPTVILIGRHQRPARPVIRTVMGVRGEPSVPETPEEGFVWGSIVGLLDELGASDLFVSVSDTDRNRFNTHPWSVGGGGGAELRERLEACATRRLDEFIDDLGAVLLTREDDVYFSGNFARRGGGRWARRVVEGNNLRDWRILTAGYALFPYRDGALDADVDDVLVRTLFPWRTRLGWIAFGKSQEERGLHWIEYSMLFRGRVNRPSIAYSDMGTHNSLTVPAGYLRIVMDRCLFQTKVC